MLKNLIAGVHLERGQRVNLRAFILTALLGSMVGAASGSQRAARLDTRNTVKLMSPGWNLGNTLEAIPKATSWGNPEPTQALFKGVRAAGFRSVRIPVAYSQYANSNGKIDAKWLDHVAKVVTRARNADLYVMINIHWDGGWMQPTLAEEAKVRAKLATFWTQIAHRFRNFDDHLLFAGTNEVGVKDVHGPPTEENARIQNRFNQTFVSTVRKAGGNNRTRFLVVQAYNTDIDNALKFNLAMPKDVVRGKLMMEVHYYSPYNFTLNDKSDIWQWGKSATEPTATEAWANEEYVDSQFRKMKAAFVDKGVPVLLGEYSAGMKRRFPGMNAYRLLWDEYVTRSAVKHGLVPMYWDAGTDGGAFVRTSGAIQDSALVSRLTAAASR